MNVVKSDILLETVAKKGIVQDIVVVLHIVVEVEAEVEVAVGTAEAQVAAEVHAVEVDHPAVEVDHLEAEPLIVEAPAPEARVEAQEIQEEKIGHEKGVNLKVDHPPVIVVAHQQGRLDLPLGVLIKNQGMEGSVAHQFGISSFFHEFLTFY
eukprot:TRINITY_DN4652_c0_g1_i2.p2 TRINITY_DN4652_c0_g1~~TRINITY_DN4652_c0_g1_i2.p2  ORF type:complete len:152 (+),score=25.84 TRINITY_DN4652_c0_g1_i2:338-793(+)